MPRFWTVSNHELREMATATHIHYYLNSKLYSTQFVFAPSFARRSMSVHCHGEITRVASPGDTVTITGIFLPQKYEGFKGMQAGLITDTYLHGE